LRRQNIPRFGNSDGDPQMLQYTDAGSGPRFCLYAHHTDAGREWADDRKSSVGRLLLEIAFSGRLLKQPLGRTGGRGNGGWHPWWDCPNTILTKHSAGGYDEELVDKTQFFIENFKRFEKDGDVLNVVDLKRATSFWNGFPYCSSPRNSASRHARDEP
jgi:hypothetical protein